MWRFLKKYLMALRSRDIYDCWTSTPHSQPFLFNAKKVIQRTVFCRWFFQFLFIVNFQWKTLYPAVSVNTSFWWTTSFKVTLFTWQRIPFLSNRTFIHAAAYAFLDHTQLIFTCSKSTTETLAKGMKYD